MGDDDRIVFIGSNACYGLGAVLQVSCRLDAVHLSFNTIYRMINEIEETEEKISSVLLMKLERPGLVRELSGPFPNIAIFQGLDFSANESF
jgi:ATP-dependent protease Clp ATPase subunit